MKKILVSMVGLASVCNLVQADLLDIDIKIANANLIQNCTGAYSKCEARQTVTIAGEAEVVSIDTAIYPTTPLGKIQSSFEKFLEFPKATEKEPFVLYSFIPTKGDLVDREMYLAAKNITYGPGEKLAGKHNITMYTKAGDKWVMVADITTDENWAKKAFRFEPEGKLVTKIKQIKPDGTSKVVEEVYGVTDIIKHYETKAKIEKA